MLVNVLVAIKLGQSNRRPKGDFMSDSQDGYQWLSGSVQALQATEEVTVIAAPGAGKIIRLMKGFVSVSLAATGGGGEAALEDGAGGTRILEVLASAAGFYPFDFGPKGYPLTANTALILTVDGATTNEATANCTAVAYGSAS